MSFTKSSMMQDGNKVSYDVRAHIIIRTKVQRLLPLGLQVSRSTIKGHICGMLLPAPCACTRLPESWKNQSHPPSRAITTRQI